MLVLINSKGIPLQKIPSEPQLIGLRSTPFTGKSVGLKVPHVSQIIPNCIRPAIHGIIEREKTI
jgi:hypothetical protein